MPDDRKLFALTQWVLRAGIVVTMLLIGFYVPAVVVMIFAVATGRVPLDWIAHWTGVTMTADQFGRIALAALAFAITALALTHLILRALRRVVASALIGDPFVEANAAELVRVAWLLLGVEVVSALVKPTIYLLAPVAMRAKVHGVNVSITGLFAVLLIFVLAQIFRRGSAMRAELAGTV